MKSRVKDHRQPRWLQLAALLLVSVYHIHMKYCVLVFRVITLRTVITVRVQIVAAAGIVRRAGSMKRSSVRPSVCLSHHSTAAAVCGGFAAERRAGRRHRPTATTTRAPGSSGAAARVRSTALSNTCGQCHVDS